MMSGQLHALAMPRERVPQYPLDRRLGRPQTYSRHGGEEKKSLHCLCQELDPGHPARTSHYTDCNTIAPLEMVLKVNANSSLNHTWANKAHMAQEHPQVDIRNKLVRTFINSETGLDRVSQQRGYN
jgi:hypothetical protein